MRWHVSKGGTVIDTADEPTIMGWRSSGELTPDMHFQAESGGPWIPLEQSPFRLASAPIKQAAATPSGVLVLAILLTLGACGFFTWLGGRDKPAADPSTWPVVAKVPPRDLGERVAAPAAPLAVLPAPDANVPRLKPSRAAFQAQFARLGIEFKESPLADGTPRLMGIHPDKLSTVEIIGRGDLTERASLIMGLADDNAPALIRNTGMMMVFMRDTGWEKGSDWVTSNMHKKEAKITKNGVAYEVSSIIPGMVLLVAKPLALKGKKSAPTK